MEYQFDRRRHVGSYTAPGIGTGLGCLKVGDISLVAAPDAIWFLSLAGLSADEKKNHLPPYNGR